jgi:hypothetical protein
MRESDERPTPPNIFRECDDSIRAAVRFAVPQQHPHLAEKLVFRQMKNVSDPGRLQRQEHESARGQNRLHAINPPAAELAITVEKDPAS